MTHASDSRGSSARRPWALAGAVGFVLGIAVTLAAVALWPDDGPDDPAGAGGDTAVGETAGGDTGSSTTVVPAVPSTTVAPPEEPEPVRVLVVGDSIASQIGWSLEEWSQAHPGEIVVFNEAHIGCGVVRYGLKRVADGSSGPVGDVCSDWGVEVPLQVVAESEVVSWPTAVELFEPDIVVATVSSWDATDRIVPDVVDDWTALGDPVFDDYVRREYRAATDVLTATGAHLHWLLSPYLNAPILHDDHTERVDRLNELVRAAVDSLPDRDVTFVDYAAFIGPAGGERDVVIRDDGVHLSDEGFAEVAPWLVSELAR